ncbi:LacI family DNA-binding transcriptional regulator [Vibrio sp. EA2]|uniref:LacI family DNA-binding transcriptional regulator n=1 Tax=Vibrio sp. EA2 TaxID=3079860 RepID=UPI00294A31DF|nr:LacI family DNA-binding transcriptional regulator [Vibrio sp. EA2]MDV6252870.1 LacI family DNA-binding transcriptional regulator [Vibrio sp. EA2]
MKKNAPNKRVTIADLAMHAGVSTATVDRVLNRRSTVRRQTIEKVLASAEELGFRATRLVETALNDTYLEKNLAVILLSQKQHFYKVLGESIQNEAYDKFPRCKVKIFYLDDLNHLTYTTLLYRISGSYDTIAVVAPEHPLIIEAIDKLASSGVNIVSLLSQLNTNEQIYHLGINPNVMGRLAAWYIHHMANDNGSVGIISGSKRFQCQSRYMIGFHSYFDEYAPDTQVIESTMSLENYSLAIESVEELLVCNPDLSAIYCAGGGSEGVIEALKNHRSEKEIFTVCHELTDVTRNALNEGFVHTVLSTRKEQLVEQLFKVVYKSTVDDGSTLSSESIFIDSYCRENI